MTVIGFVYFTQKITRTQTKSRLSAGRLGTRLRGSSVGGNLLSQVAKMADRPFADRVVLPVTAAIYRNGEEKPAVRWSFEMGIGRERVKMLFDFIVRVRKGFRIADRCTQLNMATETFQYTNFYSCHPPDVKKGFIKGEALRLLRTNSSQITFEEYQTFSKPPV